MQAFQCISLSRHAPCVGTTPASAPPLSWTARSSPSSPACPAPRGAGRPRCTRNWTDINTNVNSAFPQMWDFSVYSGKLWLKSRMRLIVLVLSHFLPHLGSFPSSIWITLPMTTLPCSVFHQFGWPPFSKSARQQLSSTMWPDLSSVVNMHVI